MRRRKGLAATERRDELVPAFSSFVRELHLFSRLWPGLLTRSGARRSRKLPEACELWSKLLDIKEV